MRVFAASSLSEAFTDLEGRFEREHPEIDVRLTFAGSQVLRLQLEQGARGDVFASANRVHMKALQVAEVIGPSLRFADNELVVIVPKDNPAKLTHFEDLARVDRLVIGTENVPIGAYTRSLLRRAEATLGLQFAEAVRGAVVSEESNVRLVRAKVELAEADAALVYRTDAAASEHVKTIAVPAELNVRAGYYVGEAIAASDTEAAGHFIAFLRSAAGRRSLERHGFLPETP